ncbi:MAG TPA: hypothetical protein PLH61_10000 [Bacteroidia bacterium]|nr:hypothetical protein [Bacteroidia bacterium]
MLRVKEILWVIVLALSTNLSSAQSCFDCGNGTMGDFHAVVSGVIQGGEYDYNSFIIDEGVTLKVVGTKPLIIRVKNNVVINGTLDASGSNGQNAVPSIKGGIGGVAVAGGFDGADGVFSTTITIPGKNGFGPGAGFSSSNLYGGGGAGYGSNGLPLATGGNAYGDSTLSQYIGGSGGASGSAANNGGSGGGGAGGGIIVIQSCKDILIGFNGKILSNGGNGGSDGNSNCSGGGGGSGGCIRISGSGVQHYGLISVIGGTGGSTSTTNNFSSGGQGSYGRIRIDFIDGQIQGQVLPYNGYSAKPFITRIWRALDPKCYNTSTGFIKTRVNGGKSPYTYLWSNGSTTNFIDNIPSGTYTVTVTDGNGCVQHDEATINEPSQIIPQILTRKPDCEGGNNGSIFVTATGGKPWPVQKSLTTTLFGTTESKGIMFDVGVSEQIQVTKLAVSLLNKTTNHISVWYKNGSFGGYEFDPNSWTHLGSYAINGQGPDTPSVISLLNPLDLGEGNYSFYLYNSDASFNCVSSNVLGSVFVFDHSLTIYEGIGRDSSATGAFNAAMQNPISFAGRISYEVVNPTGKNYNYNWASTNAQEITNLSAGSYPVKITDALGCEVYKSIELKDPDPVILNTPILSEPSCNGMKNGVVSINATGGNLEKSITTGFSNSAKAKGLMFSMKAKQNITLNKLIFTVADTTSIEIYYRQGSFSGYENNAAAWTSLGTYIVNPVNREMPSEIMLSTALTLSTGMYSFYVYDGNGQIKYSAVTNPTTTVATTQHAEMISGIAMNNGISNFGLSPVSLAKYCGDINYTIIGGAYSYNWWNGNSSTTLSNLGAGDYPVEVTDIDGCIHADTITLHEPAPITTTHSISAEIDKNNNGSASVNPTGGNAPYYIYWSPIGITGNSIQNVPAGTYDVLIADAKGCILHDSISINREITPPKPKGHLLIIPNPSSDHIAIGEEVKGMESCILRIFDATGRLIKEENTEVSKLMNRGLYLGHLSDGMYTVILQDDDQVFDAKVTIIK